MTPCLNRKPSVGRDRNQLCRRNQLQPTCRSSILAGEPGESPKATARPRKLRTLGGLRSLRTFGVKSDPDVPPDAWSLAHPSDTLDAVSRLTNSQSINLRRLGGSHVKREIVHLNVDYLSLHMRCYHLLRSGTPQYYTPMTMPVEIQDPRPRDATGDSPKYVDRWKKAIATATRVNIAWEAICEGAGSVHICISTTQARK
ncbi:hypothetical protein HYALB_00006071 [Hymenoscyphus albidus]|uniref:Uncharacterized protein n=1 Tax=Hymenoscyphus albidus TaxID=595503 RepID=A0A9N9M061_9HELO|nr:hypothetical protein HYALB_00006071 [Hymenoscyphus albidus]